MGCGASTGVMRQESELNNNVENVKEDLNGQAQQVVVNPVQEQSKPVQPKQPDKPVSKPPPPEPKNVEPSKEKSVKDEPSTKKSVPTYTEQSLQNVLNLEKELSSMERKGVVGQYQTQHKLLVSRYADLQATQKKVESLKQQTAKEYGDVAAIQHPNVRAMFSDIYQLQSQMAKEQREYMDALNRQEVAEKELKSQQQEYNALYAEVESLQKQCEELQRLREKHEKKLDEIFNGKYGSEVEEQLETEADLLTERKELIVRTRNYWSNAKVLMEHAAQQLAFSTRRWAQINTVNQSMVQARYSMVEETRNYLIAASQNITNTHRFLTNVTLPYFTSDSLKLLNHSISTIFNDVMTRESYMQALQTYSSFNNKANSLLLWITMVLEKNINKDLELIVPLWKEKVLALKRERLRLIHVKIKELQGEDTSEDMPDEVLCLGNEPEQLTEMQSDTHIAKPDAVLLNEEPDVPPPLPGEESSSVPARTSSSKESSSPEKDASLTSPVGKDDEGTPPPNTETNLSSRSTGDGEESPALTMATKTAPDQPSKDVAETNETQEDDAKIAELLETAMKLKPLVELAPVPDMDVLFGNIEELKTKYEEQVAQFSKAQDVNKARLDQALQDKLQARRIRKQAIELKDTSELAKGVTSNVGKLF